jgi:hypothetical protein
MKIIRKSSRTSSVNRNGQVVRAQIRYIVKNGDTDTSDDAPMLNAVREAAPASLGSALRDGAEIVDCRNQDLFEVAVNYISPAENSTSKERHGRRDGDRVWKSIFSCEKTRCYETLDKQRVFPAQSLPASNAGHSTGWNGRFGEGAETQSVEKLSPRCEEICRRFMFASRCSKSFRKSASLLVGKVNNSPFRGWEKGEVLLREVEISEPFENDLNQTLIELKCTFAIRRNRTGAVWQDIQLGKVGGWEHVWGISYADPADRTMKSGCAYVGRLYHNADFGILGLED